jgi:hypothetical protein
MDNKDGKKKESIDEILSDLNGLLNKMPSILDGIKMPEIKPVEFPQPAEEKKTAPAPRQEPRPSADLDADKTVVLPSFSGLPEGAPEPDAAPDAGDKTMIIENFSSVPEGGEAPKTGELVPQSLGDFMFGENAQDSHAAPEAAPVPEAAPEEAFPDFQVIEPAKEAAPAPRKADPVSFETTRDFGGIPDIDALMQLSDSDMKDLGGAQAAESAPEPAQEPAAAIEPEQAPEPEPSVSELADFEKQLKAAVPQGEAMENKPEEEKAAPQAEQQPAAEPEVTAAEKNVVPEIDFGNLTLEPEVKAEPAAEPEIPAAEKTAGPEIDFGSLTMEPEVKAEPALEPAAAAETLQLEPAAQAAPGPEAGTLQLEPQVQQPEAAPAAGGLELSLGSPASEGAQPELQPGDKAEETLSVGRPESGLVLEPASAAVSGSAPSGDETLVVPPPSGSGDEEKTVIFEAGSAPGITSRSHAGDLAGLAGRAVPEGIPAERVRALCFLYAPEDKALCATVLSELDAICLKSGDKPMFVKRAAVQECAPDMNANYILQSVTDAGGQGLICVGAIPQEKIYEVENTFSSSSGFFRHYDSSSFTHSAALDLVMDLILR